MSQDLSVKHSETSKVNKGSNHSYGTTDGDDDSDTKALPLDAIQNTIGDFGRWQCRISLLMSLLKFPAAWFQLGIVFLAPPTEFWCKPPEEYATMPPDQWKKFITPWNQSYYPHAHQKNIGCMMFDIRKDSTNKSAVIKCPWGYEYNRTQVHTNIITEWNLVCGYERLVEFTQITLMFGVLVGSILFGVLADKFGRRKVLIIAIVLQAVCGILSALSPWYWAFVLLRLLLAIANGGTITTSFVMCMEIVGGTYRTIVPILYQIPFGMGNTIMALIAYFVRYWRELQLILSGLSSLFILYACVLPESPRWLLAVGKVKEAKVVLQKAAHINKIDKDFVSKVFDGGDISTSSTGAVQTLALLKVPQLRRRMLLLCFHWLFGGMGLFGFSQYLGHITLNLYFAVAVGGLISVPGTIICVFAVKTCGRRLSIACANATTAVCFFLILAVPQGSFPHDWPRILLAGIGIGGLTVSNCALYLFTGELLPTVVRNAGIGCVVMCSKLGSMLAPMIVALGDVQKAVPLIVLGNLSILQTFLVLPLPETRNTNLPETLEDLDDTNLDYVNRKHSSHHYSLVPKKLDNSHE